MSPAVVNLNLVLLKQKPTRVYITCIYILSPYPYFFARLRDLPLGFIIGISWDVLGHNSTKLREDLPQNILKFLHSLSSHNGNVVNHNNWLK